MADISIKLLKAAAGGRWKAVFCLLTGRVGFFKKPDNTIDFTFVKLQSDDVKVYISLFKRILLIIRLIIDVGT